jgi:hypothetical protein
MQRKIIWLAKVLSERQRLFMSIGFGIFLFILFFQPFPVDRFDFNNNLLFVAGFGGIVLLLLILVFLIFRWLIRENISDGSEPFHTFYLYELIFIALSSVAFTFYLRYVGGVKISFYIMFKIIFICFIPPVAIRLYEMYNNLRDQNDLLVSEKKIIEGQVDKFENDILHRTVQFVSDNSTEILTLLITEIAFIKSADNYVEIVYKQGESYKKSLIRNTLKNIELQLSDYPNFIRCHRMCVLNKYYIEKLSRSYNNHWVTIKGYPEKIPVSRQYILKLKESIQLYGGE